MASTERGSIDALGLAVAFGGIAASRRISWFSQSRRLCFNFPTCAVLVPSDDRAKCSMCRYWELRLRRASSISSSRAVGGSPASDARGDRNIRSASVRDLACWIYRKASRAATVGWLLSARRSFTKLSYTASLSFRKDILG